jgi:hypothetical protein
MTTGHTTITISFAESEERRPFVIVRNDVPVGRTRLTAAELAVGELTAEPGYAAIRDLIRRASQSLWSVGFLSSPSSDPITRPPFDVLARVIDLGLELLDENGTFVPTDFVNIVERPAPDVAPVVFVHFRLAHATRGAEVVTPPVGGSDATD